MEVDILESLCFCRFLLISSSEMLSSLDSFSLKNAFSPALLLLVYTVMLGSTLQIHTDNYS